MDFENLHQILRSLYDEMMPLCSDMTDIAKGLAGLGALFYVALRVWQSLSRAEPIDVWTMLLDELMILCAMLVGSMTDHCALAFPAISRNRQIVMITFVLIFTFGLSG